MSSNDEKFLMSTLRLVAINIELLLFNTLSLT